MADPHPTDRFRVATWNVFNGTSVDVLSPIMADLREKGVSLFLMQEAGGDDITEMCKSFGLGTYNGGEYSREQYRVAWDRDLWKKLATRTLKLSDIEYFRKGKKTPIYSEAVEVILADSVGRSITCISYHTPPAVQVPEERRSTRRYAGMLDCFQTLGAMADDCRSIAWISGGDDNWDEDTGIQTEAVERVMAGEAVGLRQIQSPPGTSTHGRRRQIDDFRIRRIANIRPGEGWVQDGGGDHKVHAREFSWKGEWA